jgi:voltage-gated potassium channel
MSFTSILKGPYHLGKVVLKLIFSVTFLSITVIGNSIIVAFASVFHYLEASSNPKVMTFLDSVWWSFSTATTVGYGDIVPVTPEGKYVGIALMLVGTALFVTYTAIFSQAVLNDEFLRIKKMEKQESKVYEQLWLIQKNMEELKKKLNS